MSTELYIVCHTCRASLWVASASGFYGVRLMGASILDEPLRTWMQFHETRPEHSMQVLTEHHELIDEYHEWPLHAPPNTSDREGERG